MINITNEVFTFGTEIEKVIVLLTEVMLTDISLIVVDDGYYLNNIYKYYLVFLNL